MLYLIIISCDRLTSLKYLYQVKMYYFDGDLLSFILDKCLLVYRRYKIRIQKIENFGSIFHDDTAAKIVA